MTGEEIKEHVYNAFACDDMFYRPELRDAICEMVDENAKLRELVMDMYSHALHPANRPSVSGRMMELGIEVDDAGKQA